MTDFAVGLKSGWRAANGFNGSILGLRRLFSAAFNCASALNASPPNPALVRARKSRREYWRELMNTPGSLALCRGRENKFSDLSLRLCELFGVVADEQGFVADACRAG